MISIPWLFAGILSGLIIVSVFDPPKRQIPSLPVPGDSEPFHTKSGCVKIMASEIECNPNAISLNVLVGK